MVGELLGTLRGTRGLLDVEPSQDEPVVGMRDRDQQFGGGDQVEALLDRRASGVLDAPAASASISGRSVTRNRGGVRVALVHDDLDRPGTSLDRRGPRVRKSVDRQVIARIGGRDQGRRIEPARNRRRHINSIREDPLSIRCGRNVADVPITAATRDRPALMKTV